MIKVSMNRILIGLMALALSYQAVAATNVTQETVISPNGKVKFQFFYEQSNEGKSSLHYTIKFGNKNVIEKSAFNIVLDNHMSEWALAIKNPPTGEWITNLQLKTITRNSSNSFWKPVYGERNTISDRYNAIQIALARRESKDYPMNIDVRVYDEGVAFRYFFPDNPTGIYYRIMEEGTEFTFPKNTAAWFTPWAQAKASKEPLKSWTTTSERPLVLELSNGVFAALAEANVKDYVRTKFALSINKQDTIVTSMHDPVDLITGTGTPWRVVMLAESAAKLLENNDLLLNLNDASKIADTSWIKPGKIVRDMSLTNEGAFAWIDFAAKHNLQYLLFDWKWYGPAFTFESDAGKVAIDLDLPKIIAYGKSKGVGIWLYVNQQALLKQDEEIFSIYKDWGVVGVKYGFVQVGSHRWIAWLYESVRRAAKHKLMVNIHDEYRLSGEQRTWPNIVTVEGIHGNEEMPDANQNTIVPFTRGLAGAGDYTVCYFSDRIKTTHAHQLALSVVMYSPLQTLFWYDKASDFTGETEIEFFAKVPTVWDDTKVLSGEIGEHIVTSRRSGNDWFVGAITNNDARSIKIKFDFLDRNAKYLARIYFDDPSSSSKTKVSFRDVTIDSKTVQSFDLLPSGGLAIWIKKKI